MQVSELNTILGTAGVVIGTVVGAISLALYRRAAARMRERDAQSQHWRDLVNEQSERIDQMHRHMTESENAGQSRIERAEELARRADARALAADRRVTEALADVAAAVHEAHGLRHLLDVAASYLRELRRWLLSEVRRQLPRHAPTAPPVPDELRLIVGHDRLDR